MPERAPDDPSREDLDPEERTQAEIREEGAADPHDAETEREADVQAATDERPGAPGSQTTTP